MSKQITNNLSRDGSTAPIQAGSGFQTVDVSAAPKSSPFAMTGGVDTIAIPTNATEIILSATADSVNVSEVVTMSSYVTLPKGVEEVFEVSKMSAIYIEGTMSDTLNFRFNLV